MAQLPLNRYLRVFQYLLRLKRTQMELEKLWASVMHQYHSDFAKHKNDRDRCSIAQQRPQHFRPMWRVREHMAFLIRNLQFYIQVVLYILLFMSKYLVDYYKHCSKLLCDLWHWFSAVVLICLDTHALQHHT